MDHQWHKATICQRPPPSSHHTPLTHADDHNLTPQLGPRHNPKTKYMYARATVQHTHPYKPPLLPNKSFIPNWKKQNTSLTGHVKLWYQLLDSVSWKPPLIFLEKYTTIFREWSHLVFRLFLLSRSGICQCSTSAQAAQEMWTSYSVDVVCANDNGQFARIY